MELNYSSDIDLMFLYDDDGYTSQGRATTNREFFDRLGREVVRLLTESTGLGIAYRVDLRLRPGGRAAPIVVNLDSARAYRRPLWSRVGTPGVCESSTSCRRFALRL